MFKRFLAIIVCVFIMSSNLKFLIVKAEEKPKLYNLQIISNEISQNFIVGYLYDNELFVSIDDICKLTRSNYKTSNQQITIFQGIREIKIDLEQNKIKFGNQTTEFIVKSYNNKILIKPHALLCLLGAEFNYNKSNNSLFVLMPSITIYEAIQPELYSRCHYYIYDNDEFNTIIRMSASCFSDLVFDGYGNFFTKIPDILNFHGADSYIDNALIEISKVDIYDYNILEKSINNNLKRRNETIDRLKNISDYAENINSISSVYTDILKEVIGNSDTFLNKLVKELSLANDIVEWLAVAKSTEEKLNYNIDSFELIGKVLTKYNIGEIQNSDTLIKRADFISNTLSSRGATYLNSTKEQLKNKLYDTTIKALAENTSTKNIGNSTSINELSLFLMSFEIGANVTKMLMKDEFQAWDSDINAIVISEIQNIMFDVIKQSYDMNKSEGFSNYEHVNGLIDSINLYNRITIAMFSNLKKSNDEFHMYEKSFSDTWSSLCQESAENSYALYSCNLEKSVCSLDRFKDNYANDITSLIDINSCKRYNDTLENSNYTWHLDPTIEAEDIIVIDNKDKLLEEGYTSPYDECALIKQDGKYGIIKYDGTNMAEPIYGFGGYDIQGAIGVYNEYDQTKGAECVDVFPDKEALRIQTNQIRGWGYVGSNYLWINNKVAQTMDNYSIFSGEYYDDDYNVVVQSAQLDSDKRFINISNQYGIANKNGLLVPIEYDKGYMHSYNNIIALCKGEKWTYFNENGKSIIENCEGFKSNSHVIDWWEGGGYNYNEDYILPYIPTENYIPVKINGKCGYYDIQGKEVVPCGTFEEVRPVHNGLAWVKKDGKWGVIKLKDIEKPETDYQKQYYTFIENELIPKYGLANVDTDIPFSKSNGIVSAVIDDFSNTGSMDLLVIRLEHSAESIETICEWYTLKGTSVVPIDEITVKSSNGVTSNIDITFNQGYLCFTVNRIWLNSNNAKSSIWIYSLDNSKLTPLRNYEIHRFNGYVDEIVETIKKEINIKSQDYMLDLNDVKVFQDDLKSLGIEFNNEQVDCQPINRNNLLNYTLSIRESLFENCRFMITDYTNLQSHLTNTDNNNSSGNKNWQQFYADELKRYMNSDEYNNESMFDLYDIDNDGTPELFISEGGLFISLNTICTVFNGNMIKSSGNFNCIYCGGVDNLQLQVSQSTKTVRSGGIGIISYQKLENGQFISIFEGYENNKDNGENDKEYIVNGEIVTEERYNEEKLKYRYSADDYVDVGRKYKLDEVTINSVLLNT